MMELAPRTLQCIPERLRRAPMAFCIRLPPPRWRCRVPGPRTVRNACDVDSLGNRSRPLFPPRGERPRWRGPTGRSRSDRHRVPRNVCAPTPALTGGRHTAGQSIEVGTGIAGFPRPVADPSIRSNTEFPYLGLTVPVHGSAVAGRFHPHLAALGAAPLLLLVRPMGGDLHLGAAAWTSHEPVKFPRKLPNSSRIFSRPVPSKIVGESGAGNRWERRLSAAEFQRKRGGQECPPSNQKTKRTPKRAATGSRNRSCCRKRGSWVAPWEAAMAR